MTVRIAQFVHAASDVVDEAFLRDFPEVEVAKAHNLESLAKALDGAEILHVYNSAFTAEFARLVRDQGRALKWLQFTTVGIEIGLRAGLPDGVWVTNSGDVSQRALATHAMALMLGVMRGFRRFGELQARRQWPPRQSMNSHLIDPDGTRMVILGMGHIGQEIARKAKAFDMEVICVSRSPSPAVPEIDRVVRREKVDEVLPTADVVMVAMPLGRRHARISQRRKNRAHERHGDPREHFARQGGGRSGAGARPRRGPHHRSRTRRLGRRAAARSEPAVGLAQRVNHPPCGRWRRTPTVAAHERTNPRQHA